MTNVLKTYDKIFTMYRQYKVLLAKENVLEKNGASQIAAHLTVAHMVDHVVCLIKKEDEKSIEPIKVTKVNNPWKEKFGTRSLMD